MEWLSLNELPLSLWVFLPFPRMTAWGHCYLIKKRLLLLCSQWLHLHLMWKKKKNIQRGKLISCPFLWLKYNCNAVLEKEREKKRNFLWFYSPKWCMPLYLLKYLLNALNIAGRNKVKWYLNTPSFRQRYKPMSRGTFLLDLISESTFMAANQQFMNSNSFVYYKKHCATFSLWCSLGSQMVFGNSKASSYFKRV